MDKIKSNINAKFEIMHDFFIDEEQLCGLKILPSTVLPNRLL